MVRHNSNQAASPMASNIRYLNPDAIPKPGGYTHVVEVTGPGRIVYIAGQLGFGRDAKVGDFQAQAIQAFENLKSALASVGATFEHVVKLNNYLVDIRKNMPAFREARDKFVNTASPPASTTIGVPGLAREDALFEVEAVVMLPR